MKILQLLGFPYANIEHNQHFLVRKILLSTRKHWKIRILLRDKNDKNQNSWIDIHKLEGKSIAEALKENHIKISEIPTNIKNIISNELNNLIEKYDLENNKIFYTKEYATLAKQIAQVLTKSTISHNKSNIVKNNILGIFYIQQKKYYNFFEVNPELYTSCSIECKKTIREFKPFSLRNPI